jgi:Zn-dependent M28 family amino/carboxypeptidase
VRRTAVPLSIATGLLLAMLLVQPATAAPPVDSSELREAVTVDGIRAHQQEFQNIATANPVNGVPTRASGTPGFDESADYVRDLLLDAGYDVTVQAFNFAFFQELTPSEMEQTEPAEPDIVYVNGLDEDFVTMDYSGAGDVTAPVTAVDVVLGQPNTNAVTSGCDGDFAEVGEGGFGNIVPDPDGPDDFAGFPLGDIALIQRGTCTFALKVANAEAAGASAVIIFNQGNTAERSGVLAGTLGGPGNPPTLGISYALGEELAEEDATGDDLVMRVRTDTISEIRPTSNVIAETPGGRTDRTVVVGAHLDSVLAGPGINDNGSGSGTILEIALQIAELGIEPRNQIRFMWYGAEENNLLGSQFYVDSLTKTEIKDIEVMLNFDMVGSPNFVRFVYDGDGSDTPAAGPNGSDVIEDVFLDYFASQELPTEPTAFDGRSDYGPFIAVGIPAGGLFTGAEVHKTAAQVAIYGGTAGEQYDPCYHEICDTFANNSDTALDQMSDAAAHAVLTFAMSRSTVGGSN